VTLDQAIIPERIPYAREPRKLPTVLSAEEVVRFLEAVSSLKARVALTTAYPTAVRCRKPNGTLLSGRTRMRTRRLTRC